MTEIKIIQMQPYELQGLITQSVKEAVSAIMQNLQPCSDVELLTRKQACEFLQIDSSTLWEWTNKGKVQAYGTSGKRYYKKSELLEALTLLKPRKRLTSKQVA